MIGLGTVFNVVGILIGGFLGIFCKKLITERIQETLLKANGVCVLFLGIAGTLEQMFTVEDGRLSGGGTMMLILSLSLGVLLGEWIDLDTKMERFGRWLKEKTGNARDARFVDGFVTASLTVCIGAMAIVGAIQDGLEGDYATLLTKAILDCIIICVMTASMGKGAVFSVIPLVIWQGLMTVMAAFVGPLMSDWALSNLSLVGNVLIFGVGVNLVFGKKVKVANYLPALVVAVVFAMLGIRI